MTRLQSAFVLVLGVLAVAVFGRIAWGVFAPVVGAAPAFVQTVPGWVWWTVLGSLWWLPWAFGKHGCGGSSCSTPASQSHDLA